jgi:flagellin
MRIGTNAAAMNTNSNLSAANTSKANSLAKLSSGLRINKAGDDAAGLAISEKMKNQVSGMTQASRNAQDGISLIQTAEGALTETHSILNRMRDLTVQAGNTTNTADDKTAIQGEIDSLTAEVDRIASDTEFNTQGLLNGGKIDATAITASTANIGELSTAFTTVKTTGTAFTDAAGAESALKDLSKSELNKVVDSYNSNNAALSTDISASDLRTAKSTFSFQIGANAGEKISVEIDKMNSKGLGISSLDVVNGDTDDILGQLDDAIGKVSTQRANLGATQNRLDHTVSNLSTTKVNLSEANSRITDVDMAEEMTSFTKSNILAQAATSMLAQANQMPQSVLSLLQ